MAALAVLFFAPIIAGAATHFTSVYSPAVRRTIVRDTTDCLDTLQASDSVSAVVTVSVRPRDKKAKLPANFEGLFAQEFRSRFKIPSNLMLSVMVGAAPCDTIQKTCAGGVMTLGSSAYATARSDGTLSRVGVVDPSLTPVFSDSVRSALLRMSSEHLIPFFSSRESMPIEIYIGVDQRADTVSRERQLFRVTIPRYRSKFRNAGWSNAIDHPRYPRNAEVAGVGDTLFLGFTILPSGKVAAGSVELLSGNYQDFVLPVLKSLEKSTFTPARIGECRVATWVMQKFIFGVPYR